MLHEPGPSRSGKKVRRALLVVSSFPCFFRSSYLRCRRRRRCRSSPKADGHPSKPYLAHKAGICANLGRNADSKSRPRRISLIGCLTGKSLASAKKSFFMQVPKEGWVIHRRRGSASGDFDSPPLLLCSEVERGSAGKKLCFPMLCFFQWAAFHFPPSSMAESRSNRIPRKRNPGLAVPESDSHNNPLSTLHTPSLRDMTKNREERERGTERAGPRRYHTESKKMRRRREEDPCSQITLARTRLRQPI
jgi:hypothetical protein